MRVSVSTFDRQHDARTEEERAEQRRQYINDVIDCQLETDITHDGPFFYLVSN